MLPQVMAVLAQFPSVPDPGEGSGGLHWLLNSFYLLLGLGFLIAVAGHITKLRGLVIIGITLIFAGTALFLVAVGGNG